jgi:hypothetical protein
VVYNKRFDLALIEIRPNKKLFTAKIAKKHPSIGEEVWICANPKSNFRSLKKGIVSHTRRLTSNNMIEYEISGGIYPGASGGGVFNKNGELFSVVRAVEIYGTNYKVVRLNDKNEIIDGRTFYHFLPFVGFSVHPAAIEIFLEKNYYSKYLYKQ